MLTIFTGNGEIEQMAAGAKGVWRRERVGRRRHDGLGQSSLLDMEVSRGLIYQSPGPVNGSSHDKQSTLGHVLSVRSQTRAA